MLSDNKRAISSVQLLDLLEMYFTKFCQLPACLYNYCTACFRQRCLSQLRMQLQIKYFLILLNQSLTQGDWLFFCISKPTFYREKYLYL